jgi:hypothetical protein
MESSAYLDPDLPPLATTDVLVGEEGPWQANACVQWSVEQDMQAEGYRIAAERLADHAPQWHEQDFLLYPIVFLYRHYVELRLKNLIALGQQLAQQDVEVPETHDLRRLWVIAKPHLERELDPADANSSREIAQIQRVIEDLAALDPRGTAFRYATNTHGGRPLPDDASRLNLQQFATTMTKLARALDEADNWMHICLERLHDMIEYYDP